MNLLDTPSLLPEAFVRWFASRGWTARAHQLERGRRVTRRCFAVDGARLVMPAFGAFAGGLNVRNPAFAEVFGTLAFTAHMLGEGRIYAVAAGRCLAD